MLGSGHRSAATLRRLAFRLAIVLVLSVLWPGDSPARAAGVLCFLFAAVILWTAHAWSERPAGPGLNRWHEGAFLLVLGLLLFFWFGRDMASGRHSSVEDFSGIQLAEAQGYSNGAPSQPECRRLDQPKLQRLAGRDQRLLQTVMFLGPKSLICRKPLGLTRAIDD
jgi:hypothetical protein